MKYLKQFNLSESDIQDIIDFIDDMDYRELIFNKENVELILKYFISIGISNIKDVLMYKTYILYDGVESIKNKFLNVDKNIIRLINEDVMNFDLVGL